jgi:hypothetical protein
VHFLAARDRKVLIRNASGRVIRGPHYAYTLNLPTAYTPEMAVDGEDESVGGDAHRALAAIAQAARTPKSNLQIERLADPTSAPRTASLRASLAAFSG